MRPFGRHLLIAAGLVSLSLGVLGVFLPVLPTTPFLLVAAWCFLRGSGRLYRWLVAHPLLGCYIRDYQAGRGVSARMKTLALAFLWTSIVSSAVITYIAIEASVLWLAFAVLLGACALFATWFLLVRLPTAPAEQCRTRAHLPDEL